MKRVLAFLLLFARNAYAAPDPDMEQRCKDIDALGGVNSCLCSEPLITDGLSGPVNGGSGYWYNINGSVTKECGGETGTGKALWLSSSQASAPSWVVPSGIFSAPSNIPLLLQWAPPVTNDGNSRIFGKLQTSGTSVPTGAARVCHRYLTRFSPDWVSKDVYPLTPTGVCAADKVADFYPNGTPAQYQWIMYPPVVGGEDVYYSGGPDAHLSNTVTTLTDCQNGWCGFEQCWEGDFITGDIIPIARTYVLNPSTGAIIKDSIHLWTAGSLTTTPSTPISFGADWIASFYKQGTCGGSKGVLYVMEAYFDTPNIGAPTYGPWIGPPSEFTSGISSPGTGVLVSDNK